MQLYKLDTVSQPVKAKKRNNNNPLQKVCPIVDTTSIRS